MAFVKFWADVESNFVESKAQEDTLYFITDTYKLYKGQTLIADKTPENLPNQFGFDLYDNSGTKLHTYDGSSAVSLKAGAFVELTENPDGTITISSANTTYELSGALSGNTFINTLTPSIGSATTSTVPAMTKATSSAAGKAGLVPAPAAGEQANFLRGDGTWAVPVDNDTKNTAGATNSSSKLFLIGATSQDENPQTYSHDTVYVDTTGVLYSGSKKVATEEYVTNTFSTAMVFKGTLGTGGTITALPTAATTTIGDTYKVITAGTYASIVAKVGDVFICSDAPAWVLVPSGDEPSGTVTNVATGDGLTGGPVTSTGTISHAVPTNAATTNSKTSVDNKYISGATSDKFGHITAITQTTAADATGAHAIVSSEDKLITERAVYYGLPNINGVHNYNSSTNIYAPTATGTANQVLISTGSTTKTPTWANLDDLESVKSLKAALTWGSGSMA